MKYLIFIILFLPLIVIAQEQNIKIYKVDSIGNIQSHKDHLVVVKKSDGTKVIELHNSIGNRKKIIAVIKK